jgi:hypothetical protein
LGTLSFNVHESFKKGKDIFLTNSVGVSKSTEFYAELKKTVERIPSKFTTIFFCRLKLWQ